MITLYIKTHRQTGLKYFGMTREEDPVKYPGSGLLWSRHLMTHGYDCDTEIYLQSEDQNYITQEALRFSRAYDIVNSNLWANLREENGLDGWPKGVKNEKLIGVSLSEEHRRSLSRAKKGTANPKHSKSMKGKRASQETRKRMSDSHLGIPRSQEIKDKISKKQKGVPRYHSTVAKWYIVVDPSGEEKTIFNLRKFCQENGLSGGHMSAVALGKRKQHKGYTCRKVESDV